MAEGVSTTLVLISQKNLAMKSEFVIMEVNVRSFEEL